MLSSCSSLSSLHVNHLCLVVSPTVDYAQLCFHSPVLSLSPLCHVGLLFVIVSASSLSCFWFRIFVFSCLSLFCLALDCLVLPYLVRLIFSSLFVIKTPFYSQTAFGFCLSSPSLTEHIITPTIDQKIKITRLMTICYYKWSFFKYVNLIKCP